MTQVYARSATYDIETGIRLFWDEVPWDGAWEQCKKGREAQAKITDTALANAANDKANQQAQYNAENTGIDQLTKVGANGLGLGASGYLANALQSIGRSYGNARQNVARVNAQRGFAATPDAAFTSGLNSANLAQAADENNAYNSAQMLTRDNMLQGLGLRQGLQTTYDPNRALGTASSSAAEQAQMGSTLGDIGRGIATGVGIAGQFAIPGMRPPTTGCWIAEALWGRDDLRTHIVRGWLWVSWRSRSRVGRLVTALYSKFGQWVAQRPALVATLRPLFNRALARAISERW